MISNWQASAFNQDPDSANQIHGDDLAQAYGFEGGLVPGVTVSAYLAHPAVEYWGMDFLNSGYLHARVNSPLYDGETFDVNITDSAEQHYAALLTRPDGTVSAEASARVENSPPPAPERRGDDLAEDSFRGLPATRDNCEQLQKKGCRATHYLWNSDNLMHRYLLEEQRMPGLLMGKEAYANMSFILGISNWAAATNIQMNPWIHLETRSQNYQAIAYNTQIIAEMAITDLFEKKGHEFFDATINLYNASDDSCLTAIDLRAIYKLRPPS